MKKIILPFLLLAGLHSQASLLDVSSSDKTVYFHPTPLLEVSLMDLGDDGGYLTVFVDYNDAEIKSERQSLQQQYPADTLQALMAEPQQSSVVFSIDQTDVHIGTLIRQGQIGPYVNLQTVIPKAQMKQILAVKSQLANLIHFTIPVRTNFTETAVVEQYVTSTQICNGLRAKTVRDFVLGLSKMKMPSDMHYLQTLESLKTEMLDHCFQTTSQSISSIEDLLKVDLQAAPAASLTAQYVDKKSVSKIYDLGTKLKIDWN